MSCAHRDWSVVSTMRLRCDDCGADVSPEPLPEAAALRAKLGEPTPCRCGEELLPPQCYLASGSSVLHSHGECRPESQPRDLEAELVAIRAKLAALVTLLVLGIVLAVLLAIVGSLAWLGASVGLGLR